MCVEICRRLKTCGYVALLLIVHASAHAAIERHTSIALAGAAIVAPTATVTVSDDKWPTILAGNPPFATRNAYGDVILHLDESSTLYHATAFTVTMKVGITYWTAAAPNTPTSVQTDLTISYDPSGNTTHNDRALYRIPGAHVVTFTVLSVTTTTAGGSQLAPLPNDVVIESQVTVERYYDFNIAVQPSVTLTPNLSGGNLGNGTLVIAWTPVPGAEAYDVEWTYASTEGIASSAPVSYDFRNNATRVTLSTTSYTISALYENGWIVARVRAAGLSNENLEQRIEGAWSLTQQSGIVSSSSAIARVAVNRHEPKLNWNLTASYAEEGKSKIVVDYFDGSLRKRQSVTLLSTANRTVVAESVPDHQGRPAVEILPAPTAESIIHYYRSFNLGAVSGKPYNWRNFDTGATACENDRDSLARSTGAGNYYSGMNPEKGTAPFSFIPDAFGWSFVQTEYTPDNTGRVRRTSGAGLDHHLGTGHETIYFYGTAYQEELDALFGSEAGYSVHYKKNMVRDANGQLSVSYLDPAGKVIATALAGDSPASLERLASNTGGEAAGVNLMSTNRKTDDSLASIAVNTHLATTDGIPDTLTYGFQPPTFTDPCAARHCYDCVYDLTINVTDNCGTQELLPEGITMPIGAPADTICNSTTVAITRIIPLPVGAHTIAKTLRLNEAALAIYIDDYIRADTCLLTLQDFIKEALEHTDFSGCDGDYCAVECAAQFAKITPDCMGDCNRMDPCEAMYNIMVADMRPGGQYARYDMDSAGNVSAPDVLSVLHTSGTGLRWGGVWTNPSSPYLDERGRRDTVVNSAGDSVPPQNLTLTEFVRFWQDSWAASLVKYHPEYCYYEWCQANDASNRYDAAMLATTGYAAAATAGYLDPLGTSPTDGRSDPFFRAGGKGAGKRTDMETALTLGYAGSTYSLTKLAVMQVYCTSCAMQSNATVNACVDAHPFGTNQDSTLRNQEWEALRGLYLAYKSQLVEQQCEADVQARPSTDCSNWIYLIGSNSSDGDTTVSPWRDRKRRFQTVKGMLGIDPNLTPEQLRAKYEADGPVDMQQACGTLCATYADAWMARLAKCSLFPGWANKEASIRRDLIDVCTRGCDQCSPFGGSTVRPSLITAGKPSSFDDVLRKYLGANYPTIDCDAALIDMPRAYAYDYDGNGGTRSVCGCEGIGSAGGCITCDSLRALITQFDSLRKGFRDYRVENLTRQNSDVFRDRPFAIDTNLRFVIVEPSMSDGRIDVQQAEGPQARTDATASRDTSLRVVTQGPDGAAGEHATIDGVANPNRIRFPATAVLVHGLDTLDPRYTDRLRDWLNKRLGFNLTWPEYLAFLDSCGKRTPPCHTCDSVAPKCDSIPVLSSSKPRWVTPNGTIDISNGTTAPFWHNDTLDVGLQFRREAPLDDTLQLRREAQIQDTLQLRSAPQVKDVPARDARMMSARDSSFFGGRTDYTALLWSGAAKVTRAKCYDFRVRLRRIPTPNPVAAAFIAHVTIVFINGVPVPFTIADSSVDGLTLIARWTAGVDGVANIGVAYTTQLSTIDTTAMRPMLFPCNCGVLLCNRPAFMEVEYINPCHAQLEAQARYDAGVAYATYLDSIRNDFRRRYVSACMKVEGREQFRLGYRTNEYHFTLYYYDQAGNLVKTVPPAGVHPLGMTPADSAHVAAYRAGTTTVRVIPTHALASLYTYNSLNQLMEQATPDGGTTQFFYDRLGRLVLSQSARQQPLGLYSYTRYDMLGRIVEVGELKPGGVAQTRDQLAAKARVDIQLRNWIAAATRKQITRTRYDEPLSPVVAGWFGMNEQEHLRNRVASTTIADVEGAADSSATHYSYDIHGNVRTLIQENTFMPVGHERKRMDYRYDLASGKVNEVHYQSGERDAFHHLYTYDADNRIVDVRTSPDSAIWDRDARYRYYLHGPLARTELGDQQVQGLDYAYTIQGWIKGVNSNTLRPERDMGRDGDTPAGSSPSPHAAFARDAFGYTLGYFGGDYHAIGGAPVSGVNGFEASVWDATTGSSGLNDSGPPLFNGNIRAMVTAIDTFVRRDGSPQGTAYCYDQLNRLTQQRAFRNLDMAANAWGTHGVLDDYYQRLSYDPNGNILTHLRNGAAAAGPLPMDSLSYHYAPGTNQLTYVSDPVAVGNYTVDLDDQQTGNYTYDPSGNMTRDSRGEIDGIDWNAYGKIDNLAATAGVGLNRYSRIIRFRYDPAGNRNAKQLGGDSTIFYVRDATGNIMAMYTEIPNGGGLFLRSRLMYGSSRLGELESELDLLTPVTLDSHYARSRGSRLYELSNHLGNVHVVVSDRRVPVAGSGATDVAYWTADERSASDYYAFGMGMVGREGGAGLCEFGFNGKESLRGVSDASAALYDFESRIYSGSLGRYLATDPFVDRYPGLSSYSGFANNPIYYVDFGGDTIVRFDQAGVFLGIAEMDANGLHGQIVDNIKILRQFQFNDPTDDWLRVLKLKEGDVAINIRTVSDIDKKIAETIDAFHKSKKGKWRFALSESKGEFDPDKGIYSKIGEMDYLSKLKMDGEQNRNKFYLADKDIAYNRQDFGNYMWGAAMRELGFSRFISRLAAHINSFLFANRDNEGNTEYVRPKWYQFRKRIDSKGDQSAIVEGGKSRGKRGGEAGSRSLGKHGIKGSGKGRSKF